MSEERILYCVWTKIDEQYEKEWVEYMDKSHYPDVLQTKCFISAKRFKVLDGKAEGNYLSMYETTSKEKLQQYIEKDAGRLRQDYLDHFGDKSKLQRVVLEEIYSLEA